MDKYKKLISNTFIFAIGTFSSKVLVFLLVPFYTNVLTSDQFGVSNLLVQTANLIIPIASIGVSNSIIRFGLDNSVEKRDVFTGGIVAVGSGYLIFLLLMPFISQIDMLDGYAPLIYLYVLTASLRSLCSQFVRSRELIKLYAVDGVLSTTLVLIFNIIFLAVFHLGIVGYVLATIVSDLISTIFLFTAAKLRKFVKFRGCDWSVLGSMVRYALPLIPTTVFWWVTNVSDTYFIRYYIGAAAVGLLGISYKVPTIINLVSGIFTDAWQVSAFTEHGPDRDRFFSNVFNSYSALIFTAASGLILFSKLITWVLVTGPTNEFYPAWQYIPFLILATSFSCFVTFLGSIYMVEKKSVATLVTTALGALVNVILNIVLIPRFGVNGGTFATFFSYFVVFVVRMIDTRRIVRLKYSPVKLVINLALLFGQCWIMLNLKSGWIVPEALLCAAVVILNLRQMLTNLQRLLFKRKKA